MSDTTTMIKVSESTRDALMQLKSAADLRSADATLMALMDAAKAAGVGPKEVAEAELENRTRGM